MKPQIAVIGFAGAEEYPKGKGPTQKQLELAKEMGERIASEGWILLTGGKGGVMDFAHQGAKSKNGITIGFIRGAQRRQANESTDVEIITGFEVGGSEFTLVHSADALVVIGGGAGTLQEIALAYRLRKPIIILSPVSGLKSDSYLDARKTIQIKKASSPAAAIKELKKMMG